MAKVKLARVILKDRLFAATLTTILYLINPRAAVWDGSGKRLLGAHEQERIDLSETAGNIPIAYEGDVLGWVTGGAHTDQIVSLIIHLINREVEKKSLAVEILDLFREINLLYNLSEKLAAPVKVKEVAAVALEEASRLILASGGAIMLASDNEDTPKAIESFNMDPDSSIDGNSIKAIVLEIMRSADARLVNNVMSHPGARGDHHNAAFIGAPLTVNRRVIGVMYLVSNKPEAYAAGDLKLLNALASQTAPALEHAILYEKTLRDAHLREEALRLQIAELSIELNKERQKQRTDEIIESEPFQHLQRQTDKLRSIIGGDFR